MSINEQQMSLMELLNRTRLQLFTYEIGTMKNSYPNGAGSGFFLKHKDKVFLVTADHVCHPFDHTPNVIQRAYKDKDVGIVNNYVEKDKNGVEMSIITPVGGFYYFDKFKFTPDKGFEDYKPFDTTFAILSKDGSHYPFKNEGFRFLDGSIIEAGLNVIVIPSETIITPATEDRYIVYGHTNHRLADDGVHLAWDTTIHDEMNYFGDNGDYYVLTPAEPIINNKWEGISGAPVLNQKGCLLGILCGGIPARNEIHVMKMNAVLSLMESTLTIEEIEARNADNNQNKDVND